MHNSFYNQRQEELLFLPYICYSQLTFSLDKQTLLWMEKQKITIKQNSQDLNCSRHLEIRVS